MSTSTSTKPAEWRKGGMTCNGLRDAGIVFDYFRTPGRASIRPDAPTDVFDIRSFNDKLGVTSIGFFESSNLKQVTSGSYGAGTLMSSNVQCTHPMNISDAQFGQMHQNEKRTQYVDYRHVDPVQVQALRQNPLSIYATPKARERPIPAFYTYTTPENYDTYTSKPSVDISRATMIDTIDGSPQGNVLGLAEQNPLMGITVGIPNETPQFTGKSYGDSKMGREYLMSVLNDNWQTDSFQFTSKDDPNKCQNKALHYFAPGYNIAPQVQQGKMIQEVGKYPAGQVPQSTTNLPWGPQKRTGNPWTQQGGVWQKSHGYPDPFRPYNATSIERSFKTQIANSSAPHIRPYAAA